jgi:hypothetical protein
VSTPRGEPQGSPDGRTALRRFTNDRRRGWHSIGIQQADSTAIPSTDSIQALSRDAVLPALVDLAGASDLAAAQQAATNLLRSVTRQQVSKRDLWPAIATAAAEAVRASDLHFAVTCGIAVLQWQLFLLSPYPELARILRPVPPQAELDLLISCYEACTMVGASESAVAAGPMPVDVETVRIQTQKRLGTLSVQDYLATPTVRRALVRQAPIIGPPDPAAALLAANEQAQLLSRKQIFLSYVREDLAIVDRIVLALVEAGYAVWIDRGDLLPGRRWQSEIKRAIESCDYFLACYSPRYWQRTESYMNEELNLAVTRYRKMPRNRTWFIPAKLEECKLSDHPIGPSETVADQLQAPDFGMDWELAIRQLIDALDEP